METHDVLISESWMMLISRVSFLS